MRVNGRADVRGLPRVMARDIRRVMSVPSPWLLAALGVFVAASSTLALAGLGARPSGPAVLASLPPLAGSLAAVSAGADFRYGSLAGELLLAGRRTTYLARTATALGIVSAALGGAMALAAAVAAQAAGQPVCPWAALPWFTVAAAFTGGCWGVAGASLAVLTQSPVASTASLLGYLLVLEPLLQAAVPRLSSALPGQATSTVQSLPGIGHLVAAAAWLGVLAVALWACGAVVFRRRDIAVTAS